MRSVVLFVLVVAALGSGRAPLPHELPGPAIARTTPAPPTRANVDWLAAIAATNTAGEVAAVLNDWIAFLGEEPLASEGDRSAVLRLLRARVDLVVNTSAAAEDQDHLPALVAQAAELVDTNRAGRFTTFVREDANQTLISLIRAASLATPLQEPILVGELVSTMVPPSLIEEVTSILESEEEGIDLVPPFVFNGMTESQVTHVMDALGYEEGGFSEIPEGISPAAAGIIVNRLNGLVSQELVSEAQTAAIIISIIRSKTAS